MKKNAVRKLKLTKETLHELETPVMGPVVGGASTLEACPPTSITATSTAAAGC